MKPPSSYIIYKPWGFLSQFVNNQTTRKNKKLLGELAEFPEGIMAVGRLDQDSEGLLMLTTDGKISEQVRSAKVEKEYHVQVDGLISQTVVDGLRAGIEIKHEGKTYLTKPCLASLLTENPNHPYSGGRVRDERHGPTSWVSITLREGKFRQVRKMVAAAGYPCLRLVRVRIGDFNISGIQPGGVREINLAEIGNMNKI